MADAMGSACANVDWSPPVVIPSASPPIRPPAAIRLTLPASPLSDQQQVLHALNRLGYGQRPGDVDRVRHLGLAAWIERQLGPERIPDDLVETLLRRYPILAKRTAELLREFPHLKDQRGTDNEILVEQQPRQILLECRAARLVRAVMSERQLQEVMVDFWLNHFNVDAHKSAVRWMIPAYEREAIRPHALGKFGDLLFATARHPAMLFYLDNWLNTDADVSEKGATAGKRQRGGLNENYARELLELHTLGVDGGYTEQDVREVARCFTGWSIDRPRLVAEFIFRPEAHDPGEKRLLGQVIPAGGGEADGRRVLDSLARHPSTARFLARKLARRFVSDDPPESLVARVAQTFQHTDGDVRAMLATIFSSPEFFSAEAYRAKIKTPLEYVASAVRALGGALTVTGTMRDGSMQLSEEVRRIGEPLYGAQAPTGYPDVAEVWVSPGALLARMNFSLALAQQRIPGVRADLSHFLDGVDTRQPDAVLDDLTSTLLPGQLNSATRTILSRQLAESPITHAMSPRSLVHTDVEKLIALILGAPEFQRR